METTGKLSVVPKEETGEQSDDIRQDDLTKLSNEEKVNPPAQSPPARFRFEMLPIPLIMDGKVQDENLAKLDKTRFWLKNVLQEQGVHDFKEVFLCTIDHKGKLFVDYDKSRASNWTLPSVS